MTVYIEYAFIDNMIINYILLKTATRFALVKTKFLWLLSSALVGTAVAIITPLFSLGNFYLIIIKIALAFLMVALAGKFISVKKYLFTLILFLLFTFASGGLIIALFSFLNVDYESYFILNYDSVMPIGVTVLIIYILSSMLLKLSAYIVKERDLRPFLRTCVLIINKKRYRVKGFIDSGNGLYDFRSGLPVAVCSTALFNKVKGGGIKKAVSTITFDTVSGRAEMQLYVIDKLLIYNGVTVNIFNNVLLGKSKTGFFNPDYDLLLPPAIF
ncbi:MAG: sigma-E processing peptidase SpoIIGA [Clostridia bacterium]|nr:sigma-E processing peptidase SpoIIGA [Clostridia bacterium]